MVTRTYSHSVIPFLIGLSWLFVPVNLFELTLFPESPEVSSGSSFSLTCNLTSSAGDAASAVMEWSFGGNVVVKNGQVAVHGSAIQDEFKRDIFVPSETISADGNTKLATLNFPFVVLQAGKEYICGATLGSSSDSQTTRVTVTNAKTLAKFGSDVELICDEGNVALFPLSSPVVWYLVDSNTGESLEVVRCGVELFTTTAAPTTPTTLTTTTLPPTPNLTTINSGSNSSLTSTATPQTTTTTTATTTTTTADASTTPTTLAQTPPPVAQRVECGSSTYHMLIKQVDMTDGGTYKCEYSYDADMKVYTWSNDLTVKVKPSPPGTPVMVNNTQSTITVSWSPSSESANNAVDNYTVEYVSLYTYELIKDSPTMLHYISNVSGILPTTTLVTIEGLEGDTRYVSRVVAHNEIGRTAGLFNTLLETAETPPPVPTTYVPVIKSNSISFMWTTVNLKGDYTEFLFDLYEMESGLQVLVYNTTVYKEDASSSGDYNLTVSGLQSSFSYCYQLQAVLRGVNETKYGSQTACFSVATDSAVPNAPTITAITGDVAGNKTGSLRIEFTPPGCLIDDADCLQKFLIQYKHENQTLFTNKSFSKTEIFKYTLSGLEAGHIYYVQLAGVVNSRKYVGEVIIGYFSELFRTDAILKTNSTDGITEVTPVDPTSPSISTASPPNSDTVIIIIVVSVLGFLLLVAIIVIIVCYKRCKEHGNMSVDNTDDDLWIDLNTPLLGPANAGYVESEYENIGIDAWAEHCKTMHADTDIKFTEEYESICQQSHASTTWTNSLEPINLQKNRYNNIVSYDHTRVVLKTQPGVLHSDYINANYIDSYDKNRAFIATQGPLPNTIEDFWRMVWENNSSVIVMITNVYEKHKKKCEQYWPDSGETKYGRMSVSLLGVEELAYWTIRRFVLKTTKVTKKRNQVEKVIFQYHYTEWPDHGIPEYTFPVLAFVKKSCAANPANGGPIVVHCSAGVGRTGTFIVLEAMMKQVTQKRTLNVMGFLRHIRGCRNHLVQTEDQYIFIHDALLDFIESGGGTEIQPKKFKTTIEELDSNFDSSGETMLEKQYKTIVKWSPASHLTRCALQDVNRSKNRKLSFIPLDNSSKVKLPKVAGENGSDYINATYLHGYFQNKEFIITQHPSAQTEYDFWRMVWDQNSMTLVMLSNIGEEDCITFYRPKGEPTDWSHKSSFKLTFTEENLDTIDVIIRDFQLGSKQDDYEMLARMFSITCWPEAYTETQAYNEGVFQFIEVVNKWHSTKRNQTGPIIVIDKYGGKAAAQFCALYTLYNQYHNDSLVDLYSLAYLYHMKRPGVWETASDYRLLYSSLMQICKPQLEEEKGNEGNGNGDFAMHTFANVRRTTLPRSPEHIVRTDTL